MTTSQSNIKGGIRLQCETSQNPAPRPQSSYPIPNFPSAETSLISLSVYASTGLGNEGILVSPAGTLPGSATATWTLFHQYYQGTPAVLPTPDALALVVSGGTFTGQPFPNALNGAIHLFWLQSIDGTKTTVFPACEITTSLDPTQGTLAGLVTSLGTIEGDIAAMGTGTQLTPAQMALAQADYQGLLADQTSIQAQATSAGLPTSSYTALAVAMTALETYLTGLPNWVSATLNTTIVPGPVTTSGTWLYEWNAATSAMSALETVIASAIATSITGLSTTIDAMATTSQLSTAQQATAWQDWLALLQDQASAVSQCAAVGLPASTYATLATDMTALLAYLTGLGISGTPTGNITIVPGPVTTAGTWLYTWNKVFTDFNTAESAITTAVNATGTAGLSTGGNLVPNWDSELGPIPGVGGNIVYQPAGGAGGYLGSKYCRALNTPGANGGSLATAMLTGNIPVTPGDTFQISAFSNQPVTVDGTGEIIVAFYAANGAAVITGPATWRQWLGAPTGVTADTWQPAMGYLQTVTRTLELLGPLASGTPYLNIVVPQASSGPAAAYMVLEGTTSGGTSEQWFDNISIVKLAAVATPTTVGHVMVPAGGGASVDASGNLTVPAVTTSAAGLAPALSGVATQYLNGDGGWSTPAGGGGSYTLPTATASVLGGVKVGAGLAIASSVLSVALTAAMIATALTYTPLSASGTAANSALLNGYTQATAATASTIALRDSAGGLTVAALYATTAALSGAASALTMTAGGWTMGTTASVPRITYGSSSATGFGLLTAANNYADLYANSGYFSSGITGTTGNFSGTMTVYGTTYLRNGANDKRLQMWNDGTNSYIDSTYGSSGGSPLLLQVSDTTICTLSGSAATFTVGISATAASFSGNATIGTSGNRQITLLSGPGAIEIQAAPGGWAEGLFINNNAQSAIIGGFGVYGAGDVIGYHYLGATYNAPLFKVDQFGNGTFVGNVTGRVTNAESGISATGTMICSVDNNGTASLASQDTPGYVRIGGSASDLPSGAGPYGNLNNIYGGSDTITQVYYNYLTPDMWLRSANYASGAWQWNGGGWAKIYTTSNIITSLNSMMAITGMSNIPVIVMGTSLPATTNYPLNSWIFMPQITAYGAQGSMYQNVSGSWANAQAGYQTIGAVAAGSISAGALSAYVALIQNVISSSSYSSGGAGFTIAGSSVPGNSTGTPTGWAIYSTAQSTKDANGNAFSAIAEFGGSINLNGYQLANLGVAKLYYTTNGANFMSSTPGLTSFTCPKMGTATSYQIMVTGAGGGQGGHGGATSVYGGSAGGAGCILITVSPGDVLSILVGAGSAGVNSGSAASGGTSSVSKGASGTPAVSVSFYGGSTTSGGNISATGAVSLYAGAVASMNSPAVGYFGGNPLWLYSGATGGVGNTAGGSCGVYPGGAANSSSGGGGASPWGPGGAATDGSTGGTPTAFGAGGGGGYTSYGGNGGPGMIMLQII